MFCLSCSSGTPLSRTLILSWFLFSPLDLSAMGLALWFQKGTGKWEQRKWGCGRVSLDPSDFSLKLIMVIWGVRCHWWSDDQPIGQTGVLQTDGLLEDHMESANQRVLSILWMLCGERENSGFSCLFPLDAVSITCPQISSELSSCPWPNVSELPLSSTAPGASSALQAVHADSASLTTAAALLTFLPDLDEPVLTVHQTISDVRGSFYQEKTVFLRCTVNSNPPARFIWKRGAETLSHSQDNGVDIYEPLYTQVKKGKPPWACDEHLSVT